MKFAKITMLYIYYSQNKNTNKDNATKHIEYKHTYI